MELAVVAADTWAAEDSPVGLAAVAADTWAVEDSPVGLAAVAAARTVHIAEVMVVHWVVIALAAGRMADTAQVVDRMPVVARHTHSVYWTATAMAVLAMEADRVGIVALVTDTVTYDKSLLY